MSAKLTMDWDPDPQKIADCDRNELRRLVAVNICDLHERLRMGNMEATVEKARRQELRLLTETMLKVDAHEGVAATEQLERLIQRYLELQKERRGDAPAAQTPPEGTPPDRGVH